MVQVCREKALRFSRRKSCPGKGRPGRVAIPAPMDVTIWSKPGMKSWAGKRRSCDSAMVRTERSSSPLRAVDAAGVLLNPKTVWTLP